MTRPGRLTRRERDAVRQADVGWLAGHLDATEELPSALVATLLRHDDPGLRHLALSHLDARTRQAGRHGSELGRLATLLPETVLGPPESALVQAGLYQRLGRHLPPARRPEWRTADLPVPVRIAWLRAEILQHPEVLRREQPGELLHRAVEQLNLVDAYRPEELVRELVASGVGVLHATALRLVRDGLRDALLAPARAREHLVGLLDTPDVAVAAGTLRELAEPWAAAGPLPRERLRRFLTATRSAPDGTRSPVVATVDAGLLAAARHGHGDLLWEVVAEPAMPPESRRSALAMLGELAVGADVPDLTGTARVDPLLFGDAVFRCLRAMHRRGVFPDEAAAPSIVEIALADHGVAAAEFATIAFPCRRAAVAALLAAPPDDPSWPRRLALLVALAGQGDDTLPVGEAVTAALATARRPEPFLAAIRTLRYAAAEPVVVDMLPVAPEAALDTLAAIGGPRTVAALTERLGLTDILTGPDRTDAATTGPAATTEPARATGPTATTEPASATDPAGARSARTVGGVAAYLRPVRHRALELLWHLTGDPRRRRALLARLDPRDVPERIARDLGGPDRRELALLAADADPARPVEVLLRLAANGDADAVPAIAGLLLRIVTELAASTRPDAPVRPGADRRTDWDESPRRRSDGWSPADPVVPDKVVRAIHALGRRLHQRGRIRPVCLLDPATSDEAGHALVATVGLDLLHRPGLTAAEQVILLTLLAGTRRTGTRAGILRLLRHPDRQVRRHAIPLLVGDGSGDDAEALSATLIALTRDRDPETVRQALVVLGQVRARWAAPAIAAGLDHPAMSVKKTAASALADAGTPAAVPKLVFWLGHHDNPGFRTALVAALRAILGAAYPATVLAAAEQPRDDRSRVLLLDALDRLLSAGAVNALAEQRSPVASTLLGRIATGRLTLGTGSVTELAEQFAAYRIAAPAEPPTPPADPPDPDVDALVRGGWQPVVAMRIVARHGRRPDRLTAADRDRLRPMLADWLRLAGQRPAELRQIVRLALAVCPAPWSADEVRVFAGTTGVLLTALSDAVTQPAASAETGATAATGATGKTGATEETDANGETGASVGTGTASPTGPAPRTGTTPTGTSPGGGPDDATGVPEWDVILAVLDAVAPTLHPAQALGIATRLRTLPPPTGGAGWLGVLRRYGAVLTRPDVERALVAAQSGPDPWRAERAILRTAFVVDDAAPAPPDDPTVGAGTADWRRGISLAVRSPEALATFRAGDAYPVPARERLAGLIEVFSSAPPAVRPTLLDWLEALQPIGAPPWTRAEPARPTGLTPRAPQLTDLDQPRSASQRERLLDMLDSAGADRRDSAAAQLIRWPEPEIRQAVLRAYLNGRIEVPAVADLAEALATSDPAELPTGDPDGAGSAEPVRERVARVAVHLAPADLRRLTPMLLTWWEQGGPAVRAAVEEALHSRPGDADRLAEHLHDRLAAGAWGFLDLLAGRPLLRTPALAELRRRLRAERGPEAADRLVLVTGPLTTGPDGTAGPDTTPARATAGQATAGQGTAATPAIGGRGTSAEPARRARPPQPAGPSQPELVSLVRTGHPEQARRALGRLAETWEEPGRTARRPAARPDPEPADLLAELLRHPERRLRAYAHRIGRRVLDRTTYLEHSTVLLGDTEPEIVRTATRALCHATYRPAIPAVVTLLAHADPTVRRTAADGLRLFGPSAVPALRHAAGRARPDRRHHYTALLDELGSVS
ncbi:HEAT repeat domain-containing protein [Plantactinospora sonchi]|uniref:HEAT repeat domain-containing protein n=1 Tax=Plantactinospora sonchi TaxID=1544735 RepID=A0ABU7S3I8_9ACTN